MMLRRTTPKPRTTQCQSCARIRTFLAVSMMLIIALPLFGDKAPPLAHLTPMRIAVGIMGLGSLAFVARWIAWRRSEDSSRHSTNQDPEVPS